MTLPNLVADIEEQQMVSLGRLLAKHGLIMSEDVAEMFTARMTQCHTDAKSQVENVLRQLIVAVKLPE